MIPSSSSSSAVGSVTQSFGTRFQITFSYVTQTCIARNQIASHQDLLFIYFSDLRHCHSQPSSHLRKFAFSLIKYHRTTLIGNEDHVYSTKPKLYTTMRRQRRTKVKKNTFYLKFPTALSSWFLLKSLYSSLFLSLAKTQKLFNFSNT